MIPHYGLIGEYEVSLDAKGRFRMPAGLLKKLGDTDHLQFVIRQGWDPHLTLYPRPVWEKEIEALNQRSELDPRVKQYAQAFWRGANEVSLDSADRIQLPKRLQTYASQVSKLILTAREDKIEIWTETEYDKLLEVPAEDYAALGRELFGNLPAYPVNPPA
ncbi:division/cell wall cluster transcriptional repressor MraZ [Neolewinella antarctica]|uniref:Transcriptional regulator MraZ n=1 Tax=Neolewinella antarctica TaxID=442734 RepID=A0ABX0X7T2_9BACT|nr:division/cell wall cluster transcriptional repressor MraZ [Neolewinella antarctica]NJC25290.1 MraZ protein [Neolewinella antarctica]